jgi:hypothetical protein
VVQDVHHAGPDDHDLALLFEPWRAEEARGGSQWPFNRWPSRLFSSRNRGSHPRFKRSNLDKGTGTTVFLFKAGS